MNFNSGFDLPHIRAELMRLEDSIIFAFIERSQFAFNPSVYAKGSIEGIPKDESFLDYFMHEIEAVHSKVRRFTSPDEYPFTDNLPAPILPKLEFPSILRPNDVNVNKEILRVYLNDIMPAICNSMGEDGNLGSTATKDMDCLQLLSRRIHFGTIDLWLNYQANL